MRSRDSPRTARWTPSAPSSPVRCRRRRLAVHRAGHRTACLLRDPVAPTVLARGPDDAAAATAQVGYPVVVEAADPAVVHKSDRGLVRLDLADAAVREVHRAIAAV